MFIDINEMDTVIADYKVDEITDNDTAITEQSIIAAVKRMRRLLSGRYDVDKIFSATGSERDTELVEICKNIALWFLVRRCNVDMLYSRVKEVYDRDMTYLKELMNGDIPADLPLRQTHGKPAAAFRSGSNSKFRHSW